MAAAGIRPGPPLTELARDGAHALFVVRSDDERALRSLAFEEADGAFVRRFPADVPDLERIYRNFEAQLPRVLAQLAGREPVPWEDALEEVAARLAGTEWFLSGSAALAVRGVEAVPRDLDLVVGDAQLVAEILDDALIEPLVPDDAHAWVARWFGRAFLHARVEWVAGVYPEIDEWASPNEFGPLAAGRLEEVEWRGHSLRLTPLDIQLAVAERRGLDERAAAVRRFLST